MTKKSNSNKKTIDRPDSYNKDIFVADLVTFVHILMIVFILLTPFGESQELIVANLFLIVLILYGWFMSTLDPAQDTVNEYRFGRCTLTEIECNLRGIDYGDGFIHRIIKPLKNMDNDTLNFFIVFFMMIWLIFNVHVLNELKGNQSIDLFQY